MQVKVVGQHTLPTPVPDVDTPVDPTPPPVSTPPPVNADLGTKLLSSGKAVLAANLHPGIGNVLQWGSFIPAFNEWWSTQASIGTNGSRQPYENITISRMNSSGVLIDSMILHDAGHGTSIGVRSEGGVRTVYMTYARSATSTATVHDLVRFPYKAGEFDRSQIAGLKIMPKPQAGYNTLAFDWDNDLMVMRNSGGTKDNYFLRKISEWIAGVDAVYGSISLGMLPPTLQGFCTVNDTLFRYVGAANGEKLIPADPTIIEQYSWNTGKLVDKVDYTSLGQTSVGVYPGGTHEPEACTMYRETDGTATLTFSVTLGVYPTHTWKMYKLSKIGDPISPAFDTFATDVSGNTSQTRLDP